MWRRVNEVVDVTRRDVEQRAQGLAFRARHLWEHRPVSDDVLVERIRAEMGRRVSHPHAIHVAVHDGHVTLEGPILSQEVQALVRRMRRFPGVRGVENRLEVHTPADDVPELRGGVTSLHRRSPTRRSLTMESWPPSVRLCAGTIGALAWLLGAPTRSLRGYALGTLGGMLVWRAATNAPVRPTAQPHASNGDVAPIEAHGESLSGQR